MFYDILLIQCLYDILAVMCYKSYTLRKAKPFSVKKIVSFSPLLRNHFWWAEWIHM